MRNGILRSCCIFIPVTVSAWGIVNDMDRYEYLTLTDEIPLDHLDGSLIVELLTSREDVDLD